MIGTFPSLFHCMGLRERSKNGGYKLLEPIERKYRHAYDYGWRRVVLGDRSILSPIDEDRSAGLEEPLGKWFDPNLANQAEAFWDRVWNRRQKVARRTTEPPPWVPAPLVPRWEEIEALKTRFQNTVGGDLSDTAFSTDASRDYLEYCKRLYAGFKIELNAYHRSQPSTAREPPESQSEPDVWEEGADDDKGGGWRSIGDILDR